MRPLLISGLVCVLCSLSGCHRKHEISVEGTVVDDETGKTLSGVQLNMESGFQQVMNHYREKHKSETNSSGQFEIGNIVARKAGDRKTSFALRASAEGYDDLTVYFKAFRNKQDLRIRLRKLPNQALPKGYIKLNQLVETLDEPRLRFCFRNNKPTIAEPGTSADFELIYKFALPKKSCDNLMGCSAKSLSGKRQQVSVLKAAGKRLAQVFYQEPLGEAPRLPEINQIEFMDEFSFDGREHQWSSQHFLRNEFLVKTLDGNYALLHFDHHGICWVLQPNGSIDIWRLRKDVSRYLWN